MKGSGPNGTRIRERLIEEGRSGFDLFGVIGTLG
jgi:hypothetical protein